jgi:hypothetical protein
MPLRKNSGDGVRRITIQTYGLRLMTPNHGHAMRELIRSLLHFEEKKEWRR